MKRIRAALIGETFTGKTCLALRMFHNEFSEGRDATVTPNFESETFDKNGKPTHLECWDTAGTERFAALTTNYLRNISVAVIVYDVCDRQSFERVNHWLGVYRDVAGDNAPFFLIGNKIDKCSEIVVSREEGLHLAESLGASKFIETSAKTGKCCDELLDAIKELDGVINYDQPTSGRSCC